LFLFFFFFFFLIYPAKYIHPNDRSLTSQFSLFLLLLLMLESFDGEYPPDHDHDLAGHQAQDDHSQAKPNQPTLTSSLSTFFTAPLPSLPLTTSRGLGVLRLHTPPDSGPSHLQAAKRCPLSKRRGVENPVSTPSMEGELPLQPAPLSHNQSTSPLIVGLPPLPLSPETISAWDNVFFFLSPSFFSPFLLTSI
jgi:hypothetical protein